MGRVSLGEIRSQLRWAPALAVSTAALVVAFGGHAAFADGQPLKVRFGGDQNATRIVLDLDKSVQTKLVSAADGSKKMVIDFPKLSPEENLEGKGQGLVGAWTLDRTPMGARLTVNLNKAASVDRRFLLAPAEGVAHYRYVIDLKAAGGATATGSPVGAKSAVIAQASLSPQAEFQLASLAKPVERPKATSAKRVIVVDAGHGGHDPGAQGANAREKDITLAAAKALKTKLERTGRYRVVLTRDNDKYVPLDGRVQIARKGDADLFISLHADAGPSPTTRGASVYTLSEKGSSRVARNAAADPDSFVRIKMPASGATVRNILFDLTQRATRNKSAAFADILINKVGDEAPVLSRGHRDAGFVVLFAPDVPAVLLEMGFMTNPDDEKLLSDPDHRRRLVGAISEAIEDYFATETQVASR